MVAAYRQHVADQDLGLLSHLGRKLGRPPPRVVWALLAEKRRGASTEVLHTFIRQRFPADLRLKAETLAWLETHGHGAASAGATAAPPPLPPKRAQRLRRALRRATQRPAATP